MAKLSTAGLFLALALAAFLPARAIEYGGFGGRPAYPREGNPRTESIFIHTLSPGAEQQEGVRVINNSPEKKTMMVYAADSTPSTGGAFACKQLGEPKTDVGAWITLDKEEVTLEPGTNEVVPFMIRVPGTADVGEHNGCILVQEKKEKGDSAGVSLAIRTGLRVAITIPGETVRKLQMAGFTVARRGDGSFLLHPAVRNLGNVSIDTDVQVVTSYFFGAVLAREGGQYPVLRSETSDWNFELPQPFWGGWYRASFAAEYDPNPEAGVGVQSGKGLERLDVPPVWFWSPPTAAGLAIEIIALAFIIFAIFLYAVSHKRKKWIRKRWASREVKAGESIQDLAREFGVSWKLLAKANKLKAPYHIGAGKMIKVPPTE
jgi:hypothetical protein